MILEEDEEMVEKWLRLYAYFHALARNTQEKGPPLAKVKSP
jgi:hypothetical protein